MDARRIFNALLTTLGTLTAGAQEIKTAFVIAMENHNWT
jgi:hypothetical protein